MIFQSSKKVSDNYFLSELMGVSKFIKHCKYRDTGKFNPEMTSVYRYEYLYISEKEYRELYNNDMIKEAYFRAWETYVQVGGKSVPIRDYTIFKLLSSLG